MRRLLAVLLVLLCVPAIASAAFSKGTWTGTGKVPAAPQAKDRRFNLKVHLERGECRKVTGIDATGNPKTEEVRGVCASFRDKSSYQVKCTFKSGVTVADTVAPPSGYVMGRGGVYSVTEKTDAKSPNTYRRVTNTVRISFKGKRATGVARYRSEQGGLPGESVCVGEMSIRLRHR